MATSTHKILLIVLALVMLVLGGAMYWGYPFFVGAPQQESAGAERFIVPLGSSSSESITKLAHEGFIKNTWAFHLIHPETITPGAYKLERNMNAFAVARVLAADPYMKWVVIPEGLRKEEIADILAPALGWNTEEKAQWVTKDTALDADHTEGVYFPDTYLIPVSESPSDVASRLRAKFEEKFSPYATAAVKQNVKWTTVIKLASIVQREAGGKSDMPLVAGILWNRLLANTRLEVDSTLQYIKGSEQGGWWPKIGSADKQLDSPYNTYKHAGLPPHPITNPGLEAIAAVLSPATTSCMYYLHDPSGQIHCSVTYEEHLMNIEKYLK